MITTMFYVLLALYLIVYPPDVGIVNIGHLLGPAILAFGLWTAAEQLRR